MGIFGKKNTLNSSGGAEDIFRESRRLMKKSLDWQVNKQEDMSSIIGMNDNVAKNLDELKQTLLKQTEQFPK